MFKTLLLRRSILLTSLFSLSLPSFATPTLDLQMSDHSPQTLRSQPVKGDRLEDKAAWSYLTTLGCLTSTAVDALAKGVVKAYGFYTIAALPVVTALDNNLRANAVGAALMPMSELDRLTQENCLRIHVNPSDCDELFGMTTGQYTFVAARYSFLPQLSYVEMEATSENTLQTQRKVKHKVNKSQKKTKVLMNEIDKYKMGFEFELSPTERIGIWEEQDGKHASVVTSNSGDWDIHPDGYSSKDTHLRTLEFRTIHGYNQDETTDNINQISKILEKISSAYSDSYKKAYMDQNYGFSYQYNLYKTQNFLELNISTSTREAKIYFNGIISNIKADVESLTGIRHLTLQFPLYQIKRVFNHVLAIPYDETNEILAKILNNDLNGCLNLRKKYDGYAKRLDPKKWQERLRAQLRFCDLNIGKLLADMESESKTAAGFTNFFTYYAGTLFNNKDYTNVVFGDKLGGHGPKALLRLLSRISFREMYNTLETKDQLIFKDYVHKLCFVYDNNQSLINECLTYNFIKYLNYSNQSVTHNINVWSWYLSIINLEVDYPHFGEGPINQLLKYSKGNASKTDQLSPPPGMPDDYMGGRFSLKNKGLGSIALIEVRCNDSDKDQMLSIPIDTFKDKMMDSTKWFFSLPAA